MKQKGEELRYSISADRMVCWFVYTAKLHGRSVTPLLAQKLVYYAQVWWLAKYGGLLIPPEEGKFEAWTHGPVLPRLFEKLKAQVDQAWYPLSVPEQLPELPSVVEEHLQEVYDVYGGCSESDLGRIACSEDPWKNARKGLQPDDVVKGRVISEKDILSFYGKLLRQGNSSG